MKQVGLLMAGQNVGQIGSDPLGSEQVVRKGVKTLWADVLAPSHAS